MDDDALDRVMLRGRPRAAPGTARRQRGGAQAECTVGRQLLAVHGHARLFVAAANARIPHAAQTSFMMSEH